MPPPPPCVTASKSALRMLQHHNSHSFSHPNVLFLKQCFAFCKQTNYKCVYSNFYKHVYSDFINVFNLILSYHVFQTINSMNVGTTPDAVTITQPGLLGKEEKVPGSRASMREAPISVLSPSRKMQRTLQGTRIRVRQARYLSQVQNLRGCPPKTP